MINRDCMKRLDQQKIDVLLKIRNNGNLAELFDTHYHKYGQMDYLYRIVDYREIIYYLHQSERQEIQEYYHSKYITERDEEKKEDYLYFYNLVKKQNQIIKNYKYTEANIKLKYSILYEVKKQPKLQPTSETKPKQYSFFGNMQVGIVNCWTNVFGKVPQQKISFFENNAQEKQRLV